MLILDCANHPESSSQAIVLDDLALGDDRLLVLDGVGQGAPLVLDIDDAGGVIEDVDLSLGDRVTPSASSSDHFPEPVRTE